MSATVTWDDWSCRVRITVGDVQRMAAARRLLEGLMGEVSSAANRFSPLSDVSVINQNAGRMVPVGSRTLAIVDSALDAAANTGGAVDPTIGLHMIRAGYIGDIESIRGQLVSDRVDGAKDTPRQADWTRVQVDHSLRRIGVPEGMALDLGATAKALTADMAALEISSALDTPVLVEIGGDLSVAGRRVEGWTIAVSETAGGPSQSVNIGRGGIATSSTIARRWRTSQGEQHHIIDPGTGRPAVGPWRTATVWSDTAVSANAASTAAIVLGDEGEAYLRELDLDARLVGVDGDVVVIGDWPAQDWAA